MSKHPDRIYMPLTGPQIARDKPLGPCTEYRRVAGQSRLGSFGEALTNVLIGYGVAVASQQIIYPHYGIHVPLPTHFEVALWFTAVSIVRSYLLRRLFNWVTTKFRSRA